VGLVLLCGRTIRGLLIRGGKERGRDGGRRGGLVIRGAREWVGPRPTSQEDGWEGRVERERKARGIPAKIHW